MSAPTRIDCAAVVAMTPLLQSKQFSLSVSMLMTTEQRRAAVLALLGDMPEQEAFEWLRRELPAWFSDKAGAAS